MKSGKPQSKFVLCICNEGSEDLEPRKVYPVLPDRAAAQEGYLRVIDESGEDYLYPAGFFVAVRLPAGVAKDFGSPSKSALRPAAGAARHTVKSQMRAVRR